MDETLFNSALWRDLYLTVRLSGTWASLSLLKFCVPAQGFNMIITLRSFLECPWISMFPSAPPRETLRFSVNKISCFLRDQPGCRVWKVHTSLFWKKLSAHTKIVALHAAALGLRDIHLTYRGVACQIYPNLSVLPHHFHIPCLHFCFLIYMVRLYTNEWTGKFSVILFVALLLNEYRILV